MKPRFEVSCLVAALLAIPTGATFAQGYPAKPVRMVVPFPAGGATDIVARLIAQKLTEALGQQVIVDNRAGAGGTIGSDVAAKSPPDGYTLLDGHEQHARDRAESLSASCLTTRCAISRR